MAKKKKGKSFSSFLNNPVDYTLVITVLLLLIDINIHTEFNIPIY